MNNRRLYESSKRSPRSTSRTHSAIKSRSRSPIKHSSSNKDSGTRRKHNSSRIKPVSSRLVCIRGLPATTSLHILQVSIAELVGPYVFVQLLEKRGSSSLKALIEFEKIDLVRKCIQMMDGSQFGGQRISVCEIEDPEKFMRENSIGQPSSSLRGVASGQRSSSPPEIREYEKRGTSRDKKTRWDEPGESSNQKSDRPQWLFPANSEEEPVTVKDCELQSSDVQSRLQALQTKLWSSVWKSRLAKKEPDRPTDTCSSAVNANFSMSNKISGLGETSSMSSVSDAVSLVATDVVTGVSHIRRALETMRKSNASRDAFHTSALQLRKINDELSGWRDMYFSRESNNDDTDYQLRIISKRVVEETEKYKEKLTVDDESAATAPMPYYLANSSDLSNLAMKSIHDIQPSLTWFTIGPAQPRFSAAAAIRGGTLAPLVDLPGDKAKAVLAQFARLASAATLSRCIRTVCAGGYVDLDWFSMTDASSQLTAGGFRLGDPGLSFSNWYRCFDFVITIGQIVEAPSAYLSSLGLYKRVVELWWRLVSASDRVAGSLLWLPFYELFDKSWRIYAARSPEYRDKLHVFDAWWVFHQLDPVALQLRVPLPPYEVRSSSYLTQVAAHYEEMLAKPQPADSSPVYKPQHFNIGLDSCSVCGDTDHKMVESGRSLPMFCPFTSRRITWCTDYYEGLCEREDCKLERRHVCVHCGNPGQYVQTCPNCKFLVV